MKKNNKSVEEFKINDKKINIKASVNNKEQVKKRYTNKTISIMNIIFIIIIVIMAIITIDIICVSKYNKGPFFSLPLKKYNDGGTVEYYGIGYKVIKYNQIIGRRGMELGFYNLKYSTDPYNFDDIDLSIDFVNDPNETYKKYYNKFLRIRTKLNSIDTKNNTINVGYKDTGKYNLDIKCIMADKKSNIKDFIIDSDITVIGTLREYHNKDGKSSLVLNNCFAEQ